MDTSAPAARPVDGPVSLSSRVRIEDALLFAWLVLQPTLFPVASAVADAGSRRDVVGGLLDLVALCLAAACVGARSRPGVQSGLVGGTDGIAYAVGPLFGAVAFVVDNTTERLGLSDGNLAVLPLLLAVAAAIVARLRLPPLSGEQRRALVTPFILATSGFFGSFLVGLTDLFDIRSLIAAFSGPDDPRWTLFVLGIATLGVLVFYLMLVFAPRQIAEREGTTGSWAVRFLVFIVGLSLGTTIHGFFGVA